MKIDLRSFITDVPDFPKAGIVFKDISPLLGNPLAFTEAIVQMKQEWSGHVDSIAVLDARGFLFGAPLAIMMGLPLTMLRKKGKLPGSTIELTYNLEYGSGCLEVQKDAFKKGARVLVIDDLLATGGTAYAACELVEISGAVVAGCAFVAELAALGGRKLLARRKVRSLVVYKE